MDRPARKLPNTASRLIAMAVSMVGSAQEVMACMRCSTDDFQKYCNGEKEPTWPELDRLVGLIIEKQRILIAKNRESIDRVRAKLNKPKN
jgi:hypothetical protein